MESLAALKIHATLDDLARIRNFVKQELATCGVDPDTIYDLVFAVNEIVTNALVHGYGPAQGKSGPIEVEIGHQNQTWKLAVRDRAPVYDPNQAPVPDITLPLEARKPGGLGVYLTKQILDQLVHRPLEGGGNEVVLIKQVLSEQSPS